MTEQWFPNKQKRDHGAWFCERIAVQDTSEVRLAFGSTGGVERRTEIATLGLGFERRSTGLQSLDDMAARTAFFEARRGRLYGFQFRDFAAFKSCAPGETDPRIEIDDGTRPMFRLCKAYGMAADFPGGAGEGARVTVTQWGDGYGWGRRRSRGSKPSLPLSAGGRMA